MKKHVKRIGIVIVALVFAVATFVGVKWYLQSRELIPSKIINQANFLVFAPSGSTAVSIEKSSIKLDSNPQLLSFVVFIDGTKVAITEQQEPESFTDAPEVYTQLLNKMREYQEFNSGFGTIALTLPVELNGNQAAVVDSKGTLLFAQPSKGLSEDQWLKIFNNMKLVQ